MRGAGGPLFDFAAARRSDPQTAKDAAASITEEHLTRLQQAVYACLKAHPKGLTAQEIAGHTGVDAQSITPRLRPMATKGWIKDTGERRIPFDRTRPAIVWRAVR
jgi:DNA-binding MarR family transcriptional regulator